MVKWNLYNVNICRASNQKKLDLNFRKDRKAINATEQST